MKTCILGCLIAGASAGLSAYGQDILARWDFNNTTSLEPAQGSGTVTAVGGVTVSFASGAGSSDPASGGDNAWNLAGFPPQGRLSQTAGVEVAVPTTGYEGIRLTFDFRASSTASQRLVVLCTTDGASYQEIAAFTITTASAFTNGLTVDLSGVATASDCARFGVRLVSGFVGDSQYVAVGSGSSYSTSGTWRFDYVTVQGVPIGQEPQAPEISTQPEHQVVAAGGVATFIVRATGTPPLTYQWIHNGSELPGATEAQLELRDISEADAGEYRVVVGNRVSRALSEVATLTVEPAGVLAPPTVQFTNRLENLVRPGDAPTNTYTESVVRPGERLSIAFRVSDPGGRGVTVEPGTAGLPSSAQWELSGASGLEVTGTLTLQPGEAEVGQRYQVMLRAWNDAATTTTVWSVYVPTPAEQQVAITEYLANPTSNATLPHYNPLRRSEPASNPATADEYVEIVNLSAHTVDLQGWTLFDGNSSSPRLRFTEPVRLLPGEVVIAYGGPATGHIPVLDVPVWAATEGAAGLALNNGGDTISLRNATSDLVVRLAYGSSQVAASGSMTRFPDGNGSFVPQTSVGAAAVTPGRQYDGRRWSESATSPPVGQLSATRDAAGRVVLAWASEPGSTYTIWAAQTVTGPYMELARSLATGPYTDSQLEGLSARFYRLSRP
ncbi:MAG: hypothetical protein FJ387_20345 [Verrucomicrobia bacterium]|nr:hypothetical protein [Verrucomicrobiota bacterium]